MDNQLLIMLGEMRSDIKALHEKNDAILEQAKKTNGRVNNLEEWKSNLMGKITVIVVIGSAVLSAFVSWITKRV